DAHQRPVLRFHQLSAIGGHRYADQPSLVLAAEAVEELAPLIAADFADHCCALCDPFVFRFHLVLLVRHKPLLICSCFPAALQRCWIGGARVCLVPVRSLSTVWMRGVSAA